MHIVFLAAHMTQRVIKKDWQETVQIEERDIIFFNHMITYFHGLMIHDRFLLTGLISLSTPQPTVAAVKVTESRLRTNHVQLKSSNEKPN